MKILDEVGKLAAQYLGPGDEQGKTSWDETCGRTSCQSNEIFTCGKAECGIFLLGKEDQASSASEISTVHAEKHCLC